MLSRTIFARALGCHSCRQHLLQSFISSIGVSPAFPLQTARTNVFEGRTQQIKSYSESPLGARRDDTEEDFEVHALNDILEEVESNEDVKARLAATARRAQNEKHELLAGDGGKHRDQHPTEEVDTFSSESSATESKSEHVPWYLQNQPAVQQDNHPLAHRQKLPELPIAPPAILQPLLEYVSKDLGIDDISMLDLRALDPPPALGSNLIMIIGTARSEKHLHVSADRCCRWLRSDHNMRPFADGLLGRNEMKLKLRRKAKRSRLLSAVGAKDTGNGEADDGIRTGWVCVNLGRVPDGELPEDVEKVQRAEGFVGFGSRSQGANIVVQLMTEEKRGDVDLEKLWTGILKRAEKSKGKGEAEGQIKGLDGTTAHHAGEDQMAATTHTPAAEGSSNYFPPSQDWDTSRGQQARAYSTVTRAIRSDEIPMSVL